MKPVCLMVLDGWGIREATANNAIKLAQTPHFDQYYKKYPNTHLDASGEAVGLPDGQMGNSEVGHLNIGAGRIVYQELTRISKSIKDGDFFTKAEFIDLCKTVKASGKALHLMGLLSDGGVHSHQEHLYALLELAKKQGLTKVYIHAITDGRDVPPSSAVQFVEALEAKIKSIGIGQIATLSGRYFAMDRDNRWERVEKFYNAIVQAEGVTANSAKEAVEQSYAKGKTDEFIEPTVILKEGRMQDGNGVICFNFRNDRVREITRALTFTDFSGFARKSFPKLHYLCMTLYDETFPLPVAFKPTPLTHILADVVSKAGLKQFHCAETEKYAHVTFFFNGGEEKVYPGEERLLIPSPKVATYDMQPEMSAPLVADAVVSQLRKKETDLFIINFANGDMVGHTGVLNAAVKAVEAVDAAVGKIVDEVVAQGGVALITADHGNAETMLDEVTGQPFTAHTTNPVPFILISDVITRPGVKPGILADIAPTILDLLCLPKPAEMTGSSLILEKSAVLC